MLHRSICKGWSETLRPTDLAPLFEAKPISGFLGKGCEHRPKPIILGRWRKLARAKRMSKFSLNCRGGTAEIACRHGHRIGFIERCATFVLGREHRSATTGIGRRPHALLAAGVLTMRMFTKVMQKKYTCTKKAAELLESRTTRFAHRITTTINLVLSKVSLKSKNLMNELSDNTM
jgi:hypothetical protein